MSCRQIADIVEVMAKAGAPAEMIAAAVRQISDRDEERRLEVREQARIRKQRQREREKSAQVTDVTRDMAGQSVTERDACDLPPPSPPVSPLFPSPKPLTNNPPLSPPASVLVEAREPKSKRNRSVRLTADWVLPEEFAAFARSYRDPNHPNTQLTDEEIEREGHGIRDWSISSANGAKLDWASTWRGWVRRRTPEIIGKRPRGSAAGRSNGPQHAPKGSLHDAFAGIAAAATRDPGPDAGRFEDHGDGAGPRRGPPVLEVLDFGDDRGLAARRSGGDRDFAGPTLFTLPTAAVR